MMERLKIQKDVKRLMENIHPLTSISKVHLKLVTLRIFTSTWPYSSFSSPTVVKGKNKPCCAHTLIIYGLYFKLNGGSMRPQLYQTARAQFQPRLMPQKLP